MGTPTYAMDERLLQFATERQAEYLRAVNEHKSKRAAARALGVNYSVVHDAMRLLQKKAALMGMSPAHDMTKTVPEPFIVKGVSTYYNKDGEATGQWVKSALDHDKAIEIAREAVRALTEDVRGLAPITAAPGVCNEDLLAVYPHGDPHFGLHSFGKETGEPFNLEIAKRLTEGAVDRLVASAPAAHTAILLPLGDTLHINDRTNRTQASGHVLQADDRYVKVLGVTISAYRYCVLRLLEKHQHVVVRFVAGNHDPDAIWALAYTIAAYFDNEPRVTVDLSPAAHWFYRFGKVLIGATHGDTTKPDQLLGVMASDRAQDWGETTYRVWMTGHIHHQLVKEYPGVICESFRTMAAKDSYAASHGYRAGRDMKLIVMHREFGEIERHRCDVAMVDRQPV